MAEAKQIFSEQNPIPIFSSTYSSIAKTSTQSEPALPPSNINQDNSMNHSIISTSKPVTSLNIASSSPSKQKNFEIQQSYKKNQTVSTLPSSTPTQKATHLSNDHSCRTSSQFTHSHSETTIHYPS